MWPYWLMFLLPAWAALQTQKHSVNSSSGLRSLKPTAAWVAVCLAMTLIIGFRFKVGGDWGSYVRYLEDVRGLSLSEVLAKSDPSYQLLNWISVEMGWGIFGVNLMGAAIFSIGLAVFCRSLPRPWLALAVAVPYLFIVMAMGYSRQAIALGLAMLGLVALGRKSTLWFVAWVVLGATFHKTAVLLLPIAILSATRNRFWTAAWVTIVTFVAYTLLLEEATESLYLNYVTAEYKSEGALIRLLMNALPAAVLLIWRRRFTFSDADLHLWLWFSVISLVLFGVLMASPATTTVDRLALYLLPLQLVVFAHFPDALGKKRNRNTGLTAAVLFYYAMVQLTWLNFATHAVYWVPYRFYPLEGLF